MKKNLVLVVMVSWVFFGFGWERHNIEGYLCNISQEAHSSLLSSSSSFRIQITKSSKHLEWLCKQSGQFSLSSKGYDCTGKMTTFKQTGSESPSWMRTSFKWKKFGKRNGVCKDFVNLVKRNPS